MKRFTVELPGCRKCGANTEHQYPEWEHISETIYGEFYGRLRSVCSACGHWVVVPALDEKED